MSRLAFTLVIGVLFSSSVFASLSTNTGQSVCLEEFKVLFPQHFTNQQHLIPSTNDDEYGIAQIDSAGKRLGAALIAIPLGMLGMHRIYLGTKPIVPIFYILTFGGGFGILPFIDFVVLIMADDMKPYINNPRIFMWSNQKPATLP